MATDVDINQLKRNPTWRATLEVYERLHQEYRESCPQGDGWVSRPAAFEGIDAAQVSAIHGKLIAFGYLQFDVSGRDVGVRYQLTSDGRRALRGDVGNVDDDDDNDEC